MCAACDVINREQPIPCDTPEPIGEQDFVNWKIVMLFMIFAIVAMGYYLYNL